MEKPARAAIAGTERMALAGSVNHPERVRDWRIGVRITVPSEAQVGQHHLFSEEVGATLHGPPMLPYVVLAVALLRAKPTRVEGLERVPHFVEQYASVELQRAGEFHARVEGDVHTP